MHFLWHGVGTSFLYDGVWYIGGCLYTPLSYLRLDIVSLDAKSAGQRCSLSLV